jgi:hypothetical protein
MMAGPEARCGLEREMRGPEDRNVLVMAGRNAGIAHGAMSMQSRRAELDVADQAAA